MIDIKNGDIVLAEGSFTNSYALGRVYGTPTAKTVMLQAWDKDDKDWVGKSRRNRDSVRMVLPPDTDVEAFRAYVIERRAVMAKAIRDAEEQFRLDVTRRALGQ